MAKDKPENKKINDEDELEEDVQPDEDVKGEDKRQKEDCAEIKEQMLRIAAEFDNYKKRIQKDIDSSEKLGKAALIKDMLPIVDEFELALLAINGNADKVIAKGMEMLYSNFIDTLKREGLSEIGARGIFDPYKHEIVMTRKSSEAEGTILEVVKKGYMFDNKLLRPAAVIVAANLENGNSDDKEE